MCMKTSESCQKNEYLWYQNPDKGERHTEVSSSLWGNCQLWKWQQKGGEAEQNFTISEVTASWVQGPHKKEGPWFKKKKNPKNNTKLEHT